MECCLVFLSNAALVNGPGGGEGEPLTPVPLTPPPYDVIGGKGASVFGNTKSFLYIFTVFLSVLK